MERGRRRTPMASDNTGEPTIPTDRKDPYWDKSNPKHAEAISAMSKRFSQRFPESAAVEQPPDPLAADAAREDVQPGLPSTEEAHRHLWQDADLGELQRLSGGSGALPSGVE